MYLLVDDVCHLLEEICVLFAEQFFQILESIDCTIEIDFVYEIVSHFYLLQLHLSIRFVPFLLLRSFVYQNYPYLRHYNINSNYEMVHIESHLITFR